MIFAIGDEGEPVRLDMDAALDADSSALEADVESLKAWNSIIATAKQLPPILGSMALNALEVALGAYAGQTGAAFVPMARAALQLAKQEIAKR